MSKHSSHQKINLVSVALAVVAAASLLGTWLSAPGRDWSNAPGSREELLHRAVLVSGGAHAVGSREEGCYPPASVAVADFYLWPVEVTRGWWRAFRPDDPAAGGEPGWPVAVSYEEAVAFCAWVSERYGVRARLPGAEEWMVAASAGTAGVKYPWGWGRPDGRAAFDTTSALAVASFLPGPTGLYDMAGNLAEWALAEEGDDRAPVMGGSWAERNPDYLRVAHRLSLPVNYRGADAGFRVLIEAP